MMLLLMGMWMSLTKNPMNPNMHTKFSDFLFTFHFLSLFLSKVTDRFMTLEKIC